VVRIEKKKERLPCSATFFSLPPLSERIIFLFLLAVEGEERERKIIKREKERKGERERGSEKKRGREMAKTHN
jgi:hypothetical protein